MKTALILALALSSTLSQAASMTMENQAGGLIVITDRPCPDQVTGKGLQEAYATLGDGRRLEGCWTMFDGLVQIGWGEGRRSSFDPTRFQMREELPPIAKPQKNKLSL